MDVYSNALALPEPLREADVVGVTVSQNDAPNVIERAAQLRQLLLQLTPVARQTCVDDRDPSGLLNEVTVNDIRATAMQTGCEPHRVNSLVLRHPQR
jgi:hypothetical protein